VSDREAARTLPPVAVHLDTPSVARVYDYYLGGTTNWVVDREFGQQVLEKFPLTRNIAYVHRLFLNRVVRYLVGQGVRQFLDVGSGVLTAGATHEIADELAAGAGRAPDARVIYADNDPVAVAHAELVLDEHGDPRRHVVIEADLRTPRDLWDLAMDTELFDRDEPVAVLLVAVMHLRQQDAWGREVGPESVARLRSLLPAGSYLALSHTTDDGVGKDTEEALAGLKNLYDRCGSCPVTWRSRTDIEAMLGDFRMVAPGWTSATAWHPEQTGPSATAVELSPSSRPVVWAGLGANGR
jgi:hypothetical protein